MARLVLLSEGLTGRTYDLKVERTTVGRVADNAFEIPEASISSHHCEIILRGNEVLIKDLGSTNGTFINGEKVTEAKLKPGQILRLGTVEMRLEGAAAAAAPVKQPLDQTKVIPQGVKLGELEGTRSLVFEGQKGFEKKKNTATLYFIIGAVLVGVVLLAILIFKAFF